jgi:hypothetical protein
MDEEKFELMYRLPETKDYMPLSSAVDYLYWRSKRLGQEVITLEKTNQALEERVSNLEQKLHDLQFHVDAAD